MTNPIRKNNFKLPKKRIQKILVPTVGSKFSIHALNYAINLAKFTGSKIVSIFVISVDESSSPVGHVGEMLLGSVSYYVVHKSKKPVVIIK